MTRSIRIRGSVALALAAALALPALVGAQMKAMKVSEPVRLMGYVPLYIAIEKGYFKEQGMDVSVITVSTSGGAHTNALLRKETFAFIGGPEHNAFAKAKGMDIKAVMNVVARANVFVVARKGRGIQKIEDLRGRKISTFFYGGTPNSLMRHLLLSKGMNPDKDVTILQMADPESLSAVAKGVSDAAAITDPVLSRGIDQGIWYQIFSFPKEYGEFNYSTINVLGESTKRDRDTVQKFVDAMIRGLRAFHADHNEALRSARGFFPQMEEKILVAAIQRGFAEKLWSPDGRVSCEAMHKNNDVMIKAGLSKAPTPCEEIVDNSFWERSPARR